MSDDSGERKKAFEEAVPGGFFVEPAGSEALDEHLRRRGLLLDGEAVRSAAKAGEGNMNLTLRVVTSERSFVLKQARPWVEKYPQIPAPADRALVEIDFYESVADVPPLRRAMPRLLGADRGSRLLLLEDLGEAHDFTALYAGEELAPSELAELVDYLVALHTLPPAALDSRREVFQNRAMRALNHEHIFRLPVAADNGLDLEAFTPGLTVAAGSLKGDGAYVSRVTALGEEYLADGDTLVHGDYFPGSWLHADDRVAVIDPEFCFLGPPAFDVGFMLGHLHLAGQAPAAGETLLALYREKTGADGDLAAKARQFAGVEIMRRLIGVAQLPLACGIDRKAELLRLSRELVLG